MIHVIIYFLSLGLLQTQCLDLGYESAVILIDSGGMVFHWSLEDNNVVSFALESEAEGWLALAISDDGMMVDSQAIIGSFQSDTREASMSHYDITAKDPSGIERIVPPNADGSDQVIWDVRGEVIDGVTVIHGKRLLSSGFPGVLDWSTHEDLPVIAAIQSSYTNLAFMHSDHTPAGVTYEVSLATGQVSMESHINDEHLRHGLFMTAGFGVLLPIGVFFPRHLRTHDPLWFHLHRIFQTLGMACVGAGFVLAVLMTETDHFAHHKEHTLFGLVIVVVSSVQYCGGVLRPAVDAGFARAMWRAAHVLFGVGVVGASWANLCFGVRIIAGLEDRDRYEAGLYIWFAIVVVAYLVVWAIRAMLKEEATAPLPKEDDSGMTLSVPPSVEHSLSPAPHFSAAPVPVVLTKEQSPPAGSTSSTPCYTHSHPQPQTQHDTRTHARTNTGLGALPPKPSRPQVEFISDDAVLSSTAFTLTYPSSSSNHLRDTPSTSGPSWGYMHAEGGSGSASGSGGSSSVRRHDRGFGGISGGRDGGGLRAPSPPSLLTRTSSTESRPDLIQVPSPTPHLP
eukprot:Rmarinus@m.16381